MPSFRKPAKQAAIAIRRNLALGLPRHDQPDDGQIHSIGTARAYQLVFNHAAKWLQEKGHFEGLPRMTDELAHLYLAERSEWVRQPTLDLDRQALQTLPLIGKLERMRSELDPSPLQTEGRAYTPEQIWMIVGAQAEHNALATEIAYATGARAHELVTLLPADEREASTHREWSDERFEGREHGARYTVIGKGGLVREVILPLALAERLEERRRKRPREVSDRWVNYHQHYNIGAGHSWSESFSAASKRVLGWSTGAHGVRHAYAQERMDELQGLGHIYADALEIVSQELGHFRPDITTVYLR